MRRMFLFQSPTNVEKLLLLLLCFLIQISAHAQYGVSGRVGFSMSTMIGVKGADLVPNPGAVAGVSGEFRIIDRETFTFYLLPEFALEQKGYASRYSSGGYWSETHYNFDYLSLPVAAKLIFGNRKFRGGINVGVAPSLLIGRYSQYRNSSGDRERSGISRSNVRSFDFNAFLGGLAEYQLGPGALFVDLRYTQGFLDPYASYYAKPLLGRNYLNASPSFSVGYVFRFGNKGGGSGSKAYKPPYSPETNGATTENDEWPDSSNEQVATEEPIITNDDGESSGELESMSDDTRTKELNVVPQPSTTKDDRASSTSDFAEMIEMNKLFDIIADNQASDSDKEISIAEVMSRFTSADVPVIIEKNRVAVDYYGISDFLQYIKLNHFRYKITDRERDGTGLISEIRMHRL